MSSGVLKMLRDHSGDSRYHPLTSLLDLVDEPDATIVDKINIHKTIGKYVEAEMKSVEYIDNSVAPTNFSFKIG